MKKKLLLLIATTLTGAMLLTGCGGSATTDTEPTENTEVESIVETTESTEIVEETESTEVVESTESETVETEIPASEETESEVVDTTPEETEQEENEPETPAYTYTDMDKTMYAKSSVNVRSLPSTDGEKLGGLSARQEVHVTGQCNETGWYRIDYNGSTGYVSSSYLVNDKPAEPTPEPEEPTQPSEPTVESFPHALNSYWYDASTDAVYFYHVDGSWDWSWYETACQVLDQNTATMGVHTMTTSSVGTYAEGKIIKVKVFKQPVN